jgi:hypothetical protein
MLGILAAVLLQQPPEPAATAWGRIEYRADAVLLLVEAWPADGKLLMPRLHAPIGTLTFEGDGGKAAPGFSPNLQDWTVTKPKDAPAPAVLRVELKAPPLLPGKEPPLVEAGAGGIIVLPAHLATAHGKMLRYEPQPHKNTIGYWVDASDRVEWRFKPSKPGRFAVKLLQGCGKGQGGSSIQVKVGGAALDYVVEDTGHFQNFVERDAGVATLAEAAPSVLEIVVVKKAKAAVMDVRAVRLAPVE